MAHHDTDGRPVRTDDDSSYAGGDGGRLIQRVLFAAGASLFVVSLAIVTGAGPLSPIGPVADQNDLDESTPRPGGTVTPTATGTSAPTPTPDRTAARTAGGSPSPTNGTDDSFVGIGGTTTTGGNGSVNGTATPGNQTATPTRTTDDDDGGIFG